MACQMAPFPMTWSDVQGYSPITYLLNCDVSYSSATTYKVSADEELFAVRVHVSNSGVSIELHKSMNSLNAF